MAQIAWEGSCLDNAKLRSVYEGRLASIDADKVKELKAAGMGGAEIAREMGIGRASVYRLLASSLGRPAVTNNLQHSLLG